MPQIITAENQTRTAELDHRVPFEQYIKRVCVEDSLSSENVVRNGVTQGSVLGPILFICMMSDIDQEIEGVTVSSFADDTRISGKVGTDDERDKMQDNLRKIYYWAKQNNMSFNDSKFEVLQYGMKGQTTYKYRNSSGESLKVKSEAKDLRIIINTKVDFRAHINKVVKKARCTAGWILRVFETREAIPMMMMYKSHISPILEYSNQLWAPWMQESKLSIEKNPYKQNSVSEALKLLE